MNSSSVISGHGLYAVTDGPRPDLVQVVSDALTGGASVLQYRDDTEDTERRQREAAALRDLCRSFGITFLVDNDFELAHAVGAHGVHLSKDDVDIHAARALLGPDAIIGVSCYDSLQRARDAVRDGAGYVSFGAFFPSITKPLAPRAPRDLLWQSADLGVPRVAIGGITPDNGRSLVEAGADFLAVVSAVFAASDIRAAARRFADLYPSSRENA